MKPSLVLLHGWGVNAAIWNPILPELQASFEVTVLDLPGYGSDVAFDGEYSLRNIAQTLLERAPNKAHWVTWSLGGTIALEAARILPDRFHSLQLVSTTPCFVKRADWTHGSDEDVLKQFETDFSQDYGKALQRFLGLQTMTKDKTKARDALKLARALAKEQLEHPQPTERTLIGGLQILAKTDLRSSLNEIGIPVQVVTGTFDKVVPSAASKFLSENLPNVHSFFEFDCGHLPFIQHASEYIEALRTFTDA